MAQALIERVVSVVLFDYDEDGWAVWKVSADGEDVYVEGFVDDSTWDILYMGVHADDDD